MKIRFLIAFAFILLMTFGGATAALADDPLGESNDTYYGEKWGYDSSYDAYYNNARYGIEIYTDYIGVPLAPWACLGCIADIPAPVHSDYYPDGANYEPAPFTENWW